MKSPKYMKNVVVLGHRFGLTVPGVAGHFELRSNPSLKTCFFGRDHRRPSHQEPPATARFKYLHGAHQDAGTHYDVVVIQGIDVQPSKQRKGLATGLLREVMRAYPGVLIQGDNPEPAALAWHQHLDQMFPSRMIRFVNEMPQGRVTPGQPLDPKEIA